ncbi:MAG: adenylosuccinate synthetase [Mogibacterium sp.]|nr:adenylosuccinate synthetase [Mogibacterium sp.]
MTEVKIVIGGNFGDEGKGLMTAYFAERMMRRHGKCLVVLSNGGAQRGHTVVRDGIRHVFRHFGSGTLAGADTWCPAPFILNPLLFAQEYRELTRQLGAPPQVRVYVHPDCRVTTPFEMISNQIIEEHRGAARHGSVGVGIWETLIGGGLSWGELRAMSEEERRAYLSGNRTERMLRRLAEFGIAELPEAWREIIEAPGLADSWLQDLAEMERIVKLADASLLRDYPGIVFENGQGLLLDRAMIRKGYGHHTTPSYTGIRNPAEILREAGLGSADADVEAVYVTRSYMTRHGAGRFDTECPVAEINPAIRDLTNLPNQNQGTLRFGRLNLQALVRRVRQDFAGLEAETGIQGEYSIAMTHLNEFAHPARWNKCVKYHSFAEHGQDMCYIRSGFRDGFPG